MDELLIGMLAAGLGPVLSWRNTPRYDPKTVMAVLDTAIHVLGTNDGGLYKGVDTRLKAGHDVFWLNLKTITTHFQQLRTGPKTTYKRTHIHLNKPENQSHDRPLGVITGQSRSVNQLHVSLFGGFPGLPLFSGIAVKK